MNSKHSQLRILATWLEKREYIFRHYPSQPATSLIFFGCYFPAFFPRATRALCKLAAEHSVACAFDCCGKPLLEIERAKDAFAVSRKIGAQLQRLQVDELITVCPNCNAHLQERLALPIRTIYDKLAEWGVTRQDEAAGQVFIPCPERRHPDQLQQIRQILPNYRLKPIASVPCCGLGGAFACDKSAAQKLSAKVRQQLNGTLYTYCASCAGQFQRQDLQPVRHLLAEILQVEEEPDTTHSLYNRWQCRKL